MTKREIRTPQAFKDLITIISISFLVFLLGYFFDIFEEFIEWSREYDAKSMDEYVALLILLLISFSVFSFRRWQELRHEIGERRKAEAEVRKLNRELEDNILQLTEANRELDAFNNTVSHDLQTPVTIIGGFTKRLLKVYGAKLDPNAKDTLNVIRRHTEKMESFIKDLLSFSRSGRQEINKSEINMNELITIILDELKPLIDNRKIRFKIQELRSANGDKTLCKQVLFNLITNAIKFTRQISFAKIEIGSTHNDQEDIYWVKDNGIGFNPQDGDKLFSIFQRLHDHETFEGTGIGLSIVQRIINRHGGRAWAEGKVDEGAVFYFSLPSKV